MTTLPKNLIPLSFSLDAEAHTLHLSWNDEHESIFTWESLRRACPCAWCAGEGAMPGMVNAKTVFRQAEMTLVNLQPVGRYGLTPIWEDGHHTGIFTFEKLRALCGCPLCRAKISSFAS